MLPETPFDPAAPAISSSIPFLLGNTFHEFADGHRQAAGAADDVGAVERGADAAARRRAPAPAIEAYRKAFPAAKPFEISGLIGADLFRRGAILQTERKAAQDGAPVYAYWFGWKTPVLDGRPLAFHCQDLAFWFDNIDLVPAGDRRWRGRAQAGGADERARWSRSRGRAIRTTPASPSGRRSPRPTAA